MAERQVPTAVIFDLDGTLVQARIASWEVFREVNERFHLGVDRPEDYFALFEGNLYTSLRRLCHDEAQASEVKAALLKGLDENYTPALIPGMAAVVRSLASAATLAVMSSNAMSVLRRTLSDNGLAFCFAHVFGGDVVEGKRAAIEQFLADTNNGLGRRCEGCYDEAGCATSPQQSTTVLVTDTAGDVREGVAAGVRVVGVAWGMHSVEDLMQAGAEFVAVWPQEILSHLLGPEADRPTGACALPGAEPVGARHPEDEAPVLAGSGAPSVGGSCPGHTGGTCRVATCPAPAAGAVSRAADEAGAVRRRRRRAATGATRRAVQPGYAASPAERVVGADPIRPNGDQTRADLVEAVRAICPEPTR